MTPAIDHDRPADAVETARLGHVDRDRVFGHGHDDGADQIGLRDLDAFLAIDGRPVMTHEIGTIADRPGAEEGRDVDIAPASLVPGRGRCHEDLPRLDLRWLRDVDPFRVLRLRDDDVEVEGLPADLDGIVATAGIDLDLLIGQRAIEIDRIVAAARDDEQAFDRIDLGHDEAGAIDPLDVPSAGVLLDENHEGIVDLGTDDGQGVETGPAKDMDRGVLDIGQGVAFARRAVDVDGIARLQVGLRGGVLDEQGLEIEGIVVLVAIERDLGQVVIDLEVVVARAAVEAGRERDAVRDALDDLDPAVFRMIEEGRLEDVADEEAVIAGIAVDIEFGAAVVDEEQIVTGAPVDREVLGREVVDALAEDRWIDGRVANDDVGIEVACRIEDRTLAAVAGTRRQTLDDVALETERVVAGRAPDGQAVETEGARIADIDKGVERSLVGAAQRDVVDVTGLGAVEDGRLCPGLDRKAVDAGRRDRETVPTRAVHGREFDALEDPVERLGLAHEVVANELAVDEMPRTEGLDRQGRVAEPEVGIAPLDERIPASGIAEAVDAGAAGHGVVTEAGIDAIDERRARDPVIAVAGVDLEIAEQIVRDGRGVNVIVARARVDEQRITGGRGRVPAVRDRESDPARLLDGQVLAVSLGTDEELVGAGGTEDPKHVALGIDAVFGRDEDVFLTRVLTRRGIDYGQFDLARTLQQTGLEVLERVTRRQRGIDTLALLDPDVPDLDEPRRAIGLVEIDGLALPAHLALEAPIDDRVLCQRIAAGVDALPILDLDGPAGLVVGEGITRGRRGIDPLASLHAIARPAIVRDDLDEVRRAIGTKEVMGHPTAFLALEGLVRLLFGPRVARIVPTRGPRGIGPEDRALSRLHDRARAQEHGLGDRDVLEDLATPIVDGDGLDTAAAQVVGRDLVGPLAEVDGQGLDLAQVEQ